MATCTGCGGSGKIESWQADGECGSKLVLIDCYTCGGSGQTDG